MPKTNRKPGVHLHKTELRTGSIKSYKDAREIYQVEYYWILIARNGKTIARSSETYKRKAGAVRSMVITAEIFTSHKPKSYYDHTGNGVEVVEF